ncbi:hypothetical protein [Saccharopolyspora pogona]|uniref:hypothetical protein n=1 Tax=Saccharopolyspora pogona TaxID=333966 RepID=UPI001CC22ADC|nr:hypothetical protein [Saccharopolyspora pogona]
MTRSGLRQPYPVADPLEFFQGNTASGALGLGHDRLRDAVVDVLDVPCFLAGTGFESPLGGLGLLGLKLGAQGDLAFAVPVEATPRRCVAAAGPAG